MIPEEVPVYTYAGNDSATTFDFDCLVENENQLDVYFTDSEGNQSLLTYGTDYSIHEFNNSNGSYITYPLEASSHHVLKGESSVGAGDAEKLSLCLTLPIAQESEYGTSSELDLKSLEYSLDYLTRLIQIEARKMERAVKVQEGSGTDTDQLSININKTADNIDTIVAVNNDLSNIDAVKNDLSNIDTCATNIVSIQNASSNAQTASEKANEASVSAQFAENSADESEIWAEGTDEQVQALGGVHSSKGWANVSSQQQIQSDCAENDNTNKSYIQNKDLQYFDNTTTSFETTLNKGQANGYCPLDANSKIDETYLPKIDSGMTKFAINKGNPDLLINNSNELAFDVDNANPLTYTNIMGETRTVNALLPIDVSGTSDGTYKVALPKTGNQPYLFDGYIYIGEEFEKPFAQQKLMTNGTMGVDYFACAATSYYSSDYPYLAFDKNPSTYYASSSSSGNFEFGCLEALNIKKLTITNRPDYTTSYLASGTVYGSNDYNTWDELTTFTNSVSAMSANWDINLSSNTNYYKYYRLSCVGSDTNFAIADIKISASREIKTGDVWINPQEPNSAQQWNNADWQDFNDIILQDSSVTVSSGVITDLKQPTYNYNGINLNQTSKTDREFISRMSSPSNTKINYAIGASDSKYESPADGEWSIFGTGAINGGCYIALSNLNNGDVNMISTGGAGYGIFTKIKVKKGDVLMLQYANVSFQYMYFMPTVGGDN